MASGHVSGNRPNLPDYLAQSNVGPGGNGLMAMQLQQRHWIAADDRDAFVAWLRGEFAAANAIIDAMCQHMCAIGEAGEYDPVLNCLLTRRHNWNGVLYMQQFYSVAEVVNSLEQVIWKKQQLHQRGKLETQLSDNSAARHSSAVEEDRVLCIPAPPSDIEQATTVKQGTVFDCVSNAADDSASANISLTGERRDFANEHSDGLGIMDKEICFPSDEVKDRLAAIKRSNQCGSYRSVDGTMISVGEDVEICEDVFTHVEITKITEIIEEIQAASRRGEIGSKLGSYQGWVNVNETSQSSYTVTLALKDGDVQLMPKVIQSIIAWLTRCGILPQNTCPDSCTINIFDKEDLVLPNNSRDAWQHPLCILSVGGDCKIVFSRSNSVDQLRDCEDPWEVCLSTGSLLLLGERMHGSLKKAIPAAANRQILVCLGKHLNLSNMDIEGRGVQPKINPSSERPIHQNNSATHARNQRIKQMTLSQNTVLPLPVKPLPHMPQLMPQPPMTGMHPGLQSPLPVIAQGWSGPPMARKVPNSGTGVFFPGSDLVGPIAVPSWQSGLIMLSPFSQNCNPFVAPSSMDVNRPMHPRKGPKHAGHFNAGQVKVKGNTMTMNLSTHRKSGKEPTMAPPGRETNSTGNEQK